MNEEEFEKELYKEYFKQLRTGYTNMGYEDWKVVMVVHDDK